MNAGARLNNPAIEREIFANLGICFISNHAYQGNQGHVGERGERRCCSRTRRYCCFKILHRCKRLCVAVQP